MKIPENILESYHETKNIKSAEPFGGGHINDTFLITSVDNQKYILQKVNKNVFRTDAIVKNYGIVLKNIFEYQKKNNVKLTPDILKSVNGDFHVFDEEGSVWRLAEFIPGAKAYAISPDTDVSYNAAKAMGRFQLFLNTLPADEFDFTIINFHDPERRFKAFEDALKVTDKDLYKKAIPEIEFSLKNKNIVGEYNAVVNKLPSKVTHNDTKLDNILFYDDDNKTLVIDLDTIMPSTVLFDYGDMVRTFTSPAPEDEKDITKVGFRKEHFEALTKGYIEGLEGDLEPVEKDNLLLGAKTIIYEQILRFLTDYLLNNPYYKVKYPEHNLVRTRTQIKILEYIIDNGDELKDFIDKI